MMQTECRLYLLDHSQACLAVTTPLPGEARSLQQAVVSHRSRSRILRIGQQRCVDKSQPLNHDRFVSHTADPSDWTPSLPACVAAGIKRLLDKKRAQKGNSWWQSTGLSASGGSGHPLTAYEQSAKGKQRRGGARQVCL